MTAALVQIHIDFAADGTWTDATERFLGPLSLQEGRELSGLGTGTAVGKVSNLVSVLDNVDGYFSKGAGSGLSIAQSLVRIQWRKVAADAWETRWIGELRERTWDFAAGDPTNGSVARCRWVGRLIKWTAGNVHERVFVNRTLAQMLTVQRDEARLTAADLVIDADPGTPTPTYTRKLVAGWPGMVDFQDLTDGFIYDLTDNRIKVELPITRQQTLTQARYTDNDPVAGELSIPPPRVIERPFNIVNHVDCQLQVFHPSGQVDTNWTGPAPDTHWDYSLTFSPPANDPDIPWDTATVTYTVPFQVDIEMQVVSWEFTFGPNLNITDPAYRPGGHHTRMEMITINSSDDYPINPPRAGSIDGSGFTNWLLRYFIRNITVTALGPCITVSFEYWVAVQQPNNFYRPAPETLDNFGMINGSVTLDVGLNPNAIDFDAQLNVDDFEVQNETSILRYGLRRRPRPLIHAHYSLDPDTDDFTDEIAALRADANLEIQRHLNPTPIYAIRRASETAAYRDDIMARRISDRVHLVLDGPSQLDVDSGMFVEALETTIRPSGELEQTAWCAPTTIPEYAPPPTNLAATDNGNNTVTLTWDAPTDGGTVEDYQVYRGDDSGGPYALDSADVTMTTFTDVGQLMDGETYYYVITVTYDDGRVSAFSDEASVTVA